MPGPRLDYLRELGQRRAQAIIAEKMRDPLTEYPEDGTGCILFGGSLNNDGYGQVQKKKNSVLHVPGRNLTSWAIHRVAYVAKTGQDAAGHCSHLCDRRRCFNADHIVDENASQNNARKGCAGVIICGFHHHPIVDICTHEPKCIRPERFDVSCCLALRESDPTGWASQPDPPAGAELSAPLGIPDSDDADAMALVGDDGLPQAEASSDPTPPANAGGSSHPTALPSSDYGSFPSGF